MFWLPRCPDPARVPGRAIVIRDPAGASAGVSRLSRNIAGPDQRLAAAPSPKQRRESRWRCRLPRYIPMCRQPLSRPQEVLPLSCKRSKHRSYSPINQNVRHLLHCSMEHQQRVSIVNRDSNGFSRVDSVMYVRPGTHLHAVTY